MSVSMRAWVHLAVGGCVALAVLVGPVRASAQDQIPGVSLGLVYTGGYVPALAIQPFTGSFGGSALAPQIETIVGGDLRNSDRFEVLDQLPSGFVGDQVDYALWDRLGAVWLVTGAVEGAGDGYVLLLELHDVVYGEVRQRGRFRVPDPANSDFRMAVHRASDEIVRWATGDPGMAATRIAFTMRSFKAGTDGYDLAYNEIYLIDSDGENLQKITDFQDALESPAWSPDGTRIAYTSWKSGYPRIYEKELASGREKMLPPVRGAGDYITPAYAPDGHTIAFSVLGSDERSGIFTYDLAADCCLAYLSGGSWYDLQPTYSPDGRWMAFNTLRFGDAVPQVMVMPAQGGVQETLSPYEYGRGGYFTSPDWSPRGDLVAFHGAVERGRYHILVADLENDGRVLRQLTTEGNNEDPSWAPDGRHIVFVGERSWGYGLFVVDATSGKVRALVAGRRVGVPDWSPPLQPR
jgi:TolB protein